MTLKLKIRNDKRKKWEIYDEMVEEVLEGFKRNVSRNWRYLQVMHALYSFWIKINHEKGNRKKFIIKENVLKKNEIQEKKKHLRSIKGTITFMILTWATPVTVSATPCAVSTISHIGLRVITSSESFWTSVTSHQAHAHPPTIVRFFVEPQHPPKKVEIHEKLVNKVRETCKF
jgi:hypothetical protein